MRCCKPIIEVFEYEFDDDLLMSPTDNIYLQIFPETDIELLKDRVICDYKRIISDLERGKEPDLEFLKEQIFAISLEGELGKLREYIILYYLNN